MVHEGTVCFNFVFLIFFPEMDPQLVLLLEEEDEEDLLLHLLLGDEERPPKFKFDFTQLTEVECRNYFRFEKEQRKKVRNLSGNL